MNSRRVVLCIWIAALTLAFGVSEAQPPPQTDKAKAAEMRQSAQRDNGLQTKPREHTQQKSPVSAAHGAASSAQAKPQSKATNEKTPKYRYIGEAEKKTIDKTGKIPSTDATGKKKSVFYTDRKYRTAGQAKRQLDLPEKPTHRVEINPKDIKSGTPMQKIDPNSKGGPSQGTTRVPIPVDKGKTVRLKGAPEK